MRYATPMSITSKQRVYLRGLAHHIKPTVQVGDRGISTAVVEKVTAELLSHELIKVKIGDSDVKAKDAAVILSEGCKAHVVQVIGKTVVLYRRHPDEPTIRLPKK